MVDEILMMNGDRGHVYIANEFFVYVSLIIGQLPNTAG
jgi:hypothetical protein